jgi:hypothetical protein
MLRAGLILVILLGLGALGIAQLQVAPKISTLESDLSAANNARYSAEDAQRKAETAQRNAEEEVETLRGDLTDANDKLKGAMQFGAMQKARGDELDSELTSTKSELIEAQRDIQAWEGLGVTPQFVITMKDRLNDAHEEIAAITSEKEVLIRQLDQIKYELSRFVGPNQKVVMRDGIEGSILSVDTDWGFVVINVGEQDGVRENGELMVSRGGKLVGKVQISSVENDRSVANVLPGWLQADIKVGDEVLY